MSVVPYVLMSDNDTTLIFMIIFNYFNFLNYYRGRRINVIFGVSDSVS